jgi:hypothetical protein
MQTNTPIVLDSVTHVTAAHRGRAAVCASHGGAYAGYFAAKIGLGAVIFNDASIGRERAGLAGVMMLATLGVPAATVSYETARIGDGADMQARGVISFVNVPATAIGVAAGMPCRDALARLERVKLVAPPTPPAVREQRFDVAELGRGGVRVVVMDSNGDVKPEDAGHIIVTGSHGGLLGGRPETAVKHPVFAAVYNDAGIGIDRAGLSRFPALDQRGIAAATVSAFSARIGDGLSTLDDGYVSAINRTAAQHGGFVGQSCKEFVAAMVAVRTVGL